MAANDIYALTVEMVAARFDKVRALGVATVIIRSVPPWRQLRSPPAA